MRDSNYIKEDIRMCGDLYRRLPQEISPIIMEVISYLDKEYSESLKDEKDNSEETTPIDEKDNGDNKLTLQDVILGIFENVISNLNKQSEKPKEKVYPYNVSKVNYDNAVKFLNDYCGVKHEIMGASKREQLIDFLCWVYTQL